MTRNEFNEWAKDFRMRFPQTGEWLEKLPRETRDVWFADVFSNLELRDCLAANMQLMEDPSELEGYNRERLPGIFIGRCSRLRHERSQRESRRKSQEDAHVFAGRQQFDTSMKRILMQVEDAQDAYKDAHDGNPMPDGERHQLVEDLFAKHDVDDEREGPRYKCIRCRDTGIGVVS